MKQVLWATVAMASASTAMAGGVDRSLHPLGVLFETGNYIEFSYTTANPDISGKQAMLAQLPSGDVESGNLARGFGHVGMALKFAVSDRIDTALIYDQPYGANIAYPDLSGYFAEAATANFSSDAFTTVFRYKFDNGFSAHAGLRVQGMNANAFVPYIPGGYNGVTGTDYSYGYLVGGAYEIPDYALRVALTYFSKVSHDLATTEDSILGNGRDSVMTVETPQSVNLEFQTGIAEDMLLFGGVRWVEWSSFDITPADFLTVTGESLVAFRDDRVTYSLGVGRRLNDNWSVAVSGTYEPAKGGFSSHLSPRDGFSALGVGATYTQDNMKIQAGVQHIWIGDATTALFGMPAGEFEDNSALAFGMKVGFSF